MFKNIHILLRSDRKIIKKADSCYRIITAFMAVVLLLTCPLLVNAADTYPQNVYNTTVSEDVSLVNSDGIIPPSAPEEWDDNGIITGMSETAGWETTWQIKIRNSEGIETIYDICDEVMINDMVFENGYYNGEICELSEILPIGIPVTYRVNTMDEVEEIYFDDTADRYTDVIYNTEENRFYTGDEEISPLPVFNGEWFDDFYSIEFFLSPLDEYHKYTIDVYDYGIMVIDYEAINEEYTINKILATQETVEETETTLDGKKIEYYYEVYVDFETEAEDIYLAYRISDYSTESVEEEVLDYERFSWGDGYCGFQIGGKKDKDEQYVLEFWLQDALGNRKTPIYSIEYKVNKEEATEIKYAKGIIKGTNQTSGWDPIWQIKVCDLEGEEKIYDLCDEVKINDMVFENGYYNGENCDLNDILPKDTLVKYLVNTTGDVEEIYFYNDREIEIILEDSRVSENVLMSKLVVENYTSETKTGNVFVCIYRQSGEMSVVSKPVSIGILEQEEMEFDFANVGTEDVVKVFFWNEGMIPHINAIDYTVEELLEI